MRAARPDDDQQAIVRAVEDRLDLVAMTQDGVLPLGPERQVGEELRPRVQLDHTLAALGAHAAPVLSAKLLHLEIHPVAPSLSTGLARIPGCRSHTQDGGGGARREGFSVCGYRQPRAGRLGKSPKVEV